MKRDLETLKRRAEENLGDEPCIKFQVSSFCFIGSDFLQVWSTQYTRYITAIITSFCSNSLSTSTEFV